MVAVSVLAAIQSSWYVALSGRNNICLEFDLRYYSRVGTELFPLLSLQPVVIGCKEVAQ